MINLISRLMRWEEAVGARKEEAPWLFDPDDIH
jgi:hypothetical protein